MQPPMHDPRFIRRVTGPRPHLPPRHFGLRQQPPALIAPEQAQRRQAEALIADRIARDMDQLEIASVGSLGLFAADVRQADLPY